MQQQPVERVVRNLVIGGGVAGIATAAALGDGAIVIDASPDGYKIGESVIPEQFHDPRMAALLPVVRALPSWSPKLGTLFVDHGEAGFFPLQQHCDRAMHVMRHELEPALGQAMGVTVARERIVEVDPAGRRVRTEFGWWRSEAPLVDCSGPAMLVATALGSVRQLWPVWASWSYFDVEALGREVFWDNARAANWRSTALDVPSGDLLDDPVGHADPAGLTTLVRIDDGLWMWQIPLYRQQILSVGVVSRRGPVDQAGYEQLVSRHLVPAWRASPRLGRAAEDCGKPDGVTLHPATRAFHQRSGFARRAERAASEDWILVGDAFAFADPVYSVGTGLAVNQGLQLADQLARGGWSADLAASYHAKAEANFERAIEGFSFWYEGRVLREVAVANHVQKAFLLGETFRTSAFAAYSHVVRTAMRQSDEGVAAWIEGVLEGLDGLAFTVATSPEEGSIMLQCQQPRVDLSVARRTPEGRALMWVHDLGLSYQTDRGGGGGVSAVQALERLRALIEQAPGPWHAALDRLEAMRPTLTAAATRDPEVDAGDAVVAPGAPSRG